MKKILLSIIGIAFIAFIYLIVKYGWIFGFFSPSNHAIEDTFSINQKDLTYVCDFLQEENHERVRIELYETTGSMECYLPDSKGGYTNEYVYFEDPKLISSLKRLEEKGFMRILKENDCVLFEIWVSFGESKGLMFTKNKEPCLLKINGKNKRLTKIKSKDWFCYTIQFE